MPTSPQFRSQSPDELFAIDTLLAGEERLVRSRTAQFVTDRVRPNVARWFREGDLPVRDLAREMGQIGLLGMHLEGHGCPGTSATAYGLACLELEAGDSGIRSLVSVQGSLAMFAIHRFGSPEQKERWLPPMALGESIGCFALTEHDAGSDPAAMRTSARRDGSDWVLDGTKMWITNGTVSDVAVVWARSDEGIRGFVVPTSTPGLTAQPVHGKLSLRASLTAELVLDGVRLPADAALPEAQGLGAALACLNEARFGIVFGTMGAARDALLCALDYAGTRVAFGKPIAAMQLTQAKLADAALAVGTGTLLALHLGRLKDAGTLRAEQVSVGKLNNTRAALDVARTARGILGANGISDEYPVLRHALNLETVLTYEGTAEIHALVVGQALTGHAAFR